MFHEKEILRRLTFIEELLFLLLQERAPKRARSARLVFKDSKGNTMANITVHINDAPSTAVFTEFSGANGTGIAVPPVGAVAFVSDNPAVCTVDPASGLLGYVSAGTANITGTDAGNSLTASGAVTVSAAVAQSATVTFNTPAAS